MPFEISKIIVRLKINNPMLTYLNLSYDQCASTKDIINLAHAVRKNRTLIFLEIGGQELIGNMGVKAIADALKENNTLRSLVLFDQTISEAEIAILLDAAKQRTIPLTLKINGKMILDNENPLPAPTSSAEKAQESEEDFLQRVLSTVRLQYEKATVVTTENLFHRLKSFKELTDQSVKLIDLFPEAVIDGKLRLENIDFYRLGELENIDFNNCILNHCDFSFLLIKDCNFRQAVINHDWCFEGVYITESTLRLSSKNQITDKPIYEEQADRYDRQKFLAVKICKNYPQDIFIYDELIAHERDEFAQFKNPLEDDTDSSTYLGWKLHISVHPDDLSQAFNIAAPIISNYYSVFKVLNRKFLFDQRSDPTKSKFYLGKQITIYLEKNNQPILSAEQAKEMVTKVTAALKHAGIRTGQAPKSDAPTISEYFSLRNDKADACGLIENNIYSKNSVDAIYISAEAAGTNFNPCNYANPFTPLLLHETKFDLATHFDASNSIAMSLCAWLNEYTLISAFLTPQEQFLLKKRAFSYVAEIDDQFIKPEYRSQEGIKSFVKLAIRVISWHANFNFDINKYFFSMLAFYPDRNNIFAAALHHMEDKVNLNRTPTFPHVIEEWDDYFSFHGAPVSFVSYLLMRFKLNAKTGFKAKIADEFVIALIRAINSPDPKAQERLFNEISLLINSNDPFERKYALKLIEKAFKNISSEGASNQSISGLIRFLHNHIQYLEVKIYLANIYVSYHQCSEIELTALINDILSDYTKNGLPKELIYSYFQKVLNILCHRPNQLIGRLVGLALHDVAPAQFALALILARDIEPCQKKLDSCFNINVHRDLSSIPKLHRFAVKYLEDYLSNKNNVYSGYTFLAYNCLAEVKKHLAKQAGNGNASLIINIATTLRAHPYIASDKPDSEKVSEIVTGVKTPNPC